MTARVELVELDAATLRALAVGDAEAAASDRGMPVPRCGRCSTGLRQNRP